MLKTVSTLPMVLVPDLKIAAKTFAAVGMQIAVQRILNYAESVKAIKVVESDKVINPETKTFIQERVRWIPTPHTVSLGIIGAVALLRFYNFPSLSSAVASVGVLVGVEELIYSGITWLEATINDGDEENPIDMHDKRIVQNRLSSFRASIFAGMAFLALRTAGSITSQSRLITLGNGGMIASLVSSVWICALTEIEVRAFKKCQKEDPNIRPLILRSVTQGASLGLTALVAGAVGFILKHSGRTFQGSLAYWTAFLLTTGAASRFISAKFRVAFEKANKADWPELVKTHLLIFVKTIEALILAVPGALIANKASQSLGSVYFLSARSLKIGLSLLAIGTIGGAAFLAVEAVKEDLQISKGVEEKDTLLLGTLTQLAHTRFKWFQIIHSLLLGTAAVWSTGYWLSMPRITFWSSRNTVVLLIFDAVLVSKTYSEILKDFSMVNLVKPEAH